MKKPMKNHRQDLVFAFPTRLGCVPRSGIGLVPFDWTWKPARSLRSVLIRADDRFPPGILFLGSFGIHRFGASDCALACFSLVTTSFDLDARLGASPLLLVPARVPTVCVFLLSRCPFVSPTVNQ